MYLYYGGKFVEIVAQERAIEGSLCALPWLRLALWWIKVILGWTLF